MYKFASLLMCILGTSSMIAMNGEITRSQYIDSWKDEAMYQMGAHGIPASITLAQGILESRDGNSRLAKEGNNHFGIKCHSDWTGDRIYADDDAKNECFRKYRNARESFDDHSDFLKKQRYASLFELEIDDYKGWARGLKSCGYATSPEYAQSLIRIIEENHLEQYDEQGLLLAKNDKLPQRSSKKPKARTAADSGKGQSKKGKNEVADDRQEITLSGKHEVLVSSNHIKYVVAREGDTRESIAKEIDLNVFILNRFNDFDATTELRTGDIVYLQPKRLQAASPEYIAAEGDTWFSISQQQGIKLKRLYKLNGGSAEKPIAAGTRILLKKK